MPQRTKKIGVFDSGFGGLTILRGLVRELPEYSYVYLGDTARSPYGSRTQETIYEFTKQAVDFLFTQNCELVILACNTASSEALRRIQQEYLPNISPHKRVLGVIIPASEEAIKKTPNNRVGIIATEQTVASRAFERELKKLSQKVTVYQMACPLLVPLIEAGEHQSKVMDILLRSYLKPILKENIDTLILGCTHYAILEKKIRAIVGKKIIISEAPVVAKKLRAYLKHHLKIEATLKKDYGRTFYSTDLTEKFERLGSKFYGKKIIPKRVVLK